VQESHCGSVNQRHGSVIFTFILTTHLSPTQVRDALNGMINVWTPLVPISRENGCVRVIPGSHKLDVMSLLPPPGSSAFAAQQRTGYLVVDPDLMAKYEHKAVDIELKPGDVLLFKQQLVHSGRPNLSEGVRWSLDWRYRNPNCRNLEAGAEEVERHAPVLHLHPHLEPAPTPTPTPTDTTVTHCRPVFCGCVRCAACALLAF
jgi:hypothetical protein